jgi:ABC-2 type transport system permease protein
VSGGRLRALLFKELLEVARNGGALLPVGIMAMLSIVLPFTIVVIVPALTGHPLSGDGDLVRVSLLAGAVEGYASLPADARIQLFVFEQFLMVFLLIPITGAMSLAAHAIIGEKQARTLEPLLATPITTAELLVAKVLGALAPTLAISAAGLLIYFIAMALFAEPGVMVAMLVPRTAVLILCVGPAAALVSLQLAIVISSRVNDARTAQQFGVLIIIPLMAVLVAQFSGALWLSAIGLGVIGLGLVGVWLLLTAFSVALFERETILTRWR